MNLVFNIGYVAGLESLKFFFFFMTPKSKNLASPLKTSARSRVKYWNLEIYSP